MLLSFLYVVGAKDPPGLLCRDQVVGMEEEKAPPFLGYVIEYGEKHLANEYKMPPTVSIQQTKEIVLFQEGDQIHPASEEIVPDYPIYQQEYAIGPVYEPEYPNGPEIPDGIESSVVQRNKKQKVNDLKPMDEDDESI